MASDDIIMVFHDHIEQWMKEVEDARTVVTNSLQLIEKRIHTEFEELRKVIKDQLLKIIKEVEDFSKENLLEAEEYVKYLKKDSEKTKEEWKWKTQPLMSKEELLTKTMMDNFKKTMDELNKSHDELVKTFEELEIEHYSG